MNKKIGPFTLYTKTPNDICYGSIYTLNVTLPLPFYKKRVVRVYLPEDFSSEKEYPLLIMSDGQNIVDKYTSAYGAWEIDKRQHELIKEGYPSFIVVGIDCPVGPIERAYEYSFPHLEIVDWESGTYRLEDRHEPYSHIFYEYIARQLLPLIRKHFPISNNRKDIACGGSSMGGVYALSLLTSYPDLFGAALCFSPGYFLYNKKEVKQYMDISIPKIDLDHKLFFYTGKVGFENRFVEDTINMNQYFVDHGFNKNVGLLVDEEAEHNEYCWSMHFNEAIRFWMS